MSPRDGHPPVPEGACDVTAAEAAELLRAPGGRFAVASHRNPDGDALGTMLALHRALVAAGQDSVMCHPDETPITDEMAFLFGPNDHVQTGPPADAASRTLVAVDCASAQRLWDSDDGPHAPFAATLNIDHHHDNTRFGTHNLIAPAASSSAEVVTRVIEAAGWPITAEIATPLYVGLVTDTGRFGYSNTGEEAHRVAGVLIAAGAQPHQITERLYEEQPEARIRLLGRAIASMRSVADGRMMIAFLGADDYAAAGGTDSEGVVEVLRAIEGVVAAGLAREVSPGNFRVSLRSATRDLDVSAIAREEGGGGHVAAAGLSTTKTADEIAAWLDDRVRAQLAAAGRG